MNPRRRETWMLRHAIDGVQQRRVLERDFDFEACIRELTDFFTRATAGKGKP